MRLADARALCAGLVTASADLASDQQDLERLALWCNRFAPCCAVDGDDGLLLDVTGCAHLFGGEEAFVSEITARLAGLGIEARLGLADTPGAARALARFAPRAAPSNRLIAGVGASGTAIKEFPIEALGLAGEDARLLRRLGIVTIEALDRLPRIALSRRFPSRKREEAVLLRLDQALGRSTEPIAPVAPLPACMERLTLPEPVIDRTGVESMLGRLMPGLIATLKRKGLGVRRLELRCYRVDGDTIRCAVSTARASQDGLHLLRLLSEKLDAVDPGFGIDCMMLHAVRVESMNSVQMPLTGGRNRRGDVDLLIDRLRARLGADAVCRLEPVDCHRPEDSEREVMPDRDQASAAWARTVDRPQRPYRLFDRPEQVEAVAEAPDSPPRQFAWRGALRRVARAAGPERIEPEWWSNACNGAVRDYYDVEDSEGRRYWLFQAGSREAVNQAESSRWYVHGLYG